MRQAQPWWVTRTGIVNSALVVGVFVFLLWATLSAAAQTAAVDYDTFMQQDVNGRISTFNAVSPENKADLVRTHLQRWTDANRARLSPEQLAHLQDALMFVTSDLYRQPKPADVTARAKDLESRSAALFTREDVMQAMTIYGAHIPRTN